MEPSEDRSDPGAAPAAVQGIDIIELLKGRMREDVQNVTRDVAIVPGHYSVLVRQDVYDRLEPIVRDIGREAARELTREVGRLSRLPYDGPHAVPEDAPGDAERTIYPPDHTWSIEIVPVRTDTSGQAIPASYLAVATDLKRDDGPQILDAGGDVKMTVRLAASDRFESHFVRPADLTEQAGRQGTTVRIPFERPARRARARRPDGARLVFSYPGESEVHSVPITRDEITIGRATSDNTYVDLRLAVERQVSAVHARLRWAEAGHFEIMDVSRYGTCVGEARVPRSDDEAQHWRAVRTGDVIHLAGYVSLTLRDD